jgi:hypothetical protein
LVGPSQILNQNIGSLNFAGEKVPMNGAYILNQERFDREFFLTRFNDAQFIMIHKRQ